ncbi:MAG TPA: hypothetical protein VFA04_21780 [Bryobacteraceae bacterium]|nr:hypothetical protein [Bryobacteraceae bacterium]
MWLKQRRYAEAQTELRQTLDWYQKANSEDWNRYNCESMLGQSLFAVKKYAEAEPLVISGYEGMMQRRQAIPHGDQAWLQEAGQRLVALYGNWNKPERAAEWQRKIRAIE